MMPDQGAGGSVERPRALSASATGDGEPMQEAEVQIQQPVQEEKATLNIRKRNSISALPAEPRHSESAGSPHTSPLSRQSSSSSHMSQPVEPPVTRSTRSELDVSKIIHNPKLRHDINFDPELHFRPNLDGDKGKRKQQKASHFWTALLGELTLFVGDRPTFYDRYGHGSNWSLPALLKAVKDIIQTLVPQRDRDFLDEGLNVELLMQQFHSGVADLEKLALWLSRVLKSHCAPMRDEWVDTMYDLLSTGNRVGDLETLVNGMRSLLSVLEAMKLDVANHQIRCLRPVLIEDTINFQQKFFYKKIRSGKLDITMAREWYADADRNYMNHLGNTALTFGDTTVFFDALSQIILPSSSDKRTPSTFLFDEERIVKLRADMLDMINLEICMRVYNDMVRAARNSSTPEFRRPNSVVDEPRLPIFQSMEEFDFNTPPSTSRPSSLVFSSAGSAQSSPRSSLIIPAVPSYVAQDHVDAKTKSRSLYTSLVSLLQSGHGSSSRQTKRWQSLASSMAAQIFRFIPNAPSDMMARIDQLLAESICGTNSMLYREVERTVHSRLMDVLGKRVREFKPLSGIELFTVATGSRTSSLSHLVRDKDGDATMRDGHDEGTMEDVATRLAHLGILHWRVWADLAYVGDIEEMSLDAQSSQI